MKKSVSVLIPFITIIALSLITSCKKDFNYNNWSPAVLGPIFDGYAQASDITDLKNKTFTQSISSFNLLIKPNETVNVPPMNIAHIGPFQYQLSSYFSSVYVDSTDFVITMQNAFPITISQGTLVVFRTSASVNSSANILFSYRLPNDIAAYSTYTFETIIRNTTVPSNLYLTLDSFQSPGAQNVVFSNNPSQVTFSFKFLNVFNVSLFTNAAYTVYDTTVVQFGQKIQNTNDSAATGLLRVFLTSSMPVNFNFQMYFLDASKTTVLDSMYLGSAMAINGAPTDANGIAQDSVQKEFDIPMPAARINKIKSAGYLTFRLGGNTNGYPGSTVVVGSKCSMRVLITGDLKMYVAKIVSL